MPPGPPGWDWGGGPPQHGPPGYGMMPQHHGMPPDGMAPGYGAPPPMQRFGAPAPVPLMSCEVPPVPPVPSVGPSLVGPPPPVGPVDDITYKEFYCTACKVQTANENDYQNHMQSEEHHYVESNQETFRCSVCKITCTAIDDFSRHLSGPGHQHQVGMKEERDRRRAAGEWVEESDPEDEFPSNTPAQLIPFTETEEKCWSNPFHCPLCGVWLPTVPLLKYTHSSGADRGPFFGDSLTNSAFLHIFVVIKI